MEGKKRYAVGPVKEGTKLVERRRSSVLIKLMK